MVNRRGTSVATLIGAITLAAGCAGSPDPKETNTVTATVTMTAPAPVESTSPPIDPSSTEPSDSGSPSESTASAEVPLERRNVPLGLSDFFEPDAAWQEDRRDVASERDLKGLTAGLTSCGANYSIPLEIRLGNKFDTITVKAGLSNKSKGSNQTVVVEARANGKQVDIQRVPFNKVQPLPIKIVDVNALIFNVYLDDSVDNCSSLGSAEVVLWDIVLK